MASVLIPRSGSNTGATIATLLPEIGKAFGPVGAAIGAVGGAVAGGISGGENKRQEEIATMPQDTAKTEIPEGASDPMARRQQQIDEDPYEQLKAAHAAMQLAPKEIQDTYGEQMNEAMRIAQRQRNMA